MRNALLLLLAAAMLAVTVGCSATPVTPASNVPTLPSSPTTPPTAVATGSTPPSTAVPGQAACRVAEPIGQAVANLPPVTDQDWVRGNPNASITLIEYSDFQCPGCAGVEPVLERLLDAQGDNLRIVYRHFPLMSIHDKALITAEAAEAAGAQGAFWEMHDLLFARQQEWGSHSTNDLPTVLAGYAEELGLDVAQFRSDLENHTYQERVMASYQEAGQLGLPGTPSVIVNGRMFPFNWGLSEAALNAFLAAIALEARQFDAPPPQVITAGRQYFATVVTNKGSFVIQLYADQAPANVNSFVFLARQGWFDNVPFHRVIADFVAQTGDPTGTGIGGPGYECDDEIAEGLSYDEAGIVGIANAGHNTGSSQFFITLSPQPQLDGGYTIIGRVVEGMDVVLSLTVRDPSDPNAPMPDVIQTVTIEER